MSDAAIAQLVMGAITIMGMVTGFLTLWVKLKYSTDKAQEAVTKAEETAAHVAAKTQEVVDKAKVVEQKLDNNTTVTVQAKDAAVRASEHADTCDRERTALLKTLSDHDMRIGTLEVKLEALKVNLESLDKNVSSTRHEIRGHLQTISNNIHVLTVGARAQILGTSEEK